MKSIKNKNLAILIAMAMILSMSVTSIFAVQAAEEMLAVSSEETVIMLHSPHQGTYSEDFNNKPDENGGLEDPVVWHFVLNQLNHGQEALMIEAEFEDAGIISVEGRSVGNGSVQHFFIGTSTHDTLIDAFVVIPGESGGMLVLSHVAFGEVEDDEDEIIDDDDDEIIDDDDDEIDDDDDEIDDDDDEIIGDDDDEDEIDEEEQNDEEQDDEEQDEQEEVLGEEEQQEEQVEEEEVIQIEDEEITQGTIVEQEESTEEESEEEEVIILDEATPLGTDTLPQTGDANPIIFLLSGLMMTAIGVALKRFAF